MDRVPLSVSVAVGLLTLVACASACSRGSSADANANAGANANADANANANASADANATASADGDAGAVGVIGADGGTLREEGVKIVVPEGALATDTTFVVKRVTGAALADFPRGTDQGFTFEPANVRFKIPVTIKLPHPDGEGEVVCQTRPGERLTFQFEPMPAHRFPLHVMELPQFCAVYAPEHVRALKAQRDREAVQVVKANDSFKWEIKGKVCDPHELVRPNAHKDLREPAGIGGCPAGMAPIPGRKGACVDRWEAHLVEVMEDGTEHTWSPYFNPGGLNVRAKSAPGAVPQAYVSQVQAGAACAASKKRLCKDDEWVLACRGTKNTQFPYGADEKRGTCNDHRDRHPAMEYLERQDLSVFTKLEHPCINQVPDSLLTCGAKDACVTPEPEVAFDMVGNLHEWTADPTGHFRGGYYVDTWLNGHGCDYVTTRHEAKYWDYSTGFRCCADAATTSSDAGH
jgi:hypothetical protein